MTTATTPPASSSTVAHMTARGVLAGYPDLVALAAKGNLIYYWCFWRVARSTKIGGLAFITAACRDSRASRATEPS
jgi:hypothetical protein